ncbi:ribosomal RNA processing protein 1 homolog B-like isoform X2 [Dendronephthya gigantea]|uniref:ribosomal RNA processing protein 1 homolog B-like isoform X2 n=1 Tax=Dendronephthya gigantea TaxID=151771 RepID=UPI0010691D57|nr:ribosomal RNA processing protein 1 homolog B-like isoform X2 [Dendronephthya gigantea]
MAAPARQVSGGAETYFAKKLASNEKTVRDKAVKKLKIWISTRHSTSSGLSESDMLKLWKGLFYCMWMSDKRSVQEELAENIAQLLHCFQKTTAGLEYIDGFYKTICREWHGIDRLRLDKFYLLIRKFVYQTFVFLKNNAWNNETIESVNKMLEDGPLSSSEYCPDGVKIHIIQVFIEELLKCSTNQIPSSAISQLLQPFIKLLATSTNKVITKTVAEEIFTRLSQKVADDREQDFFLKVDFVSISDQFFSWASRKDIPVRNRQLLYHFNDKFRTASKNCCESHDIEENGKHGSPSEPEGNCNGNDEASLSNCDATSMDIDVDVDCEVIVKRKKKGGKRKQNKTVEGNVHISDMDTSSVNELVKNKKSGKEKINQKSPDLEMEIKNKVLDDDNTAVNEDSRIHEKNDKFANECSMQKIRKCKKREGVLESRSEQKSDMINVEPKSKRKRETPFEKKPCEEVHENGKSSKKKRKSNQKAVVSQSSNEKESVENENNKDWLEIMDNTSDSLDGSYLSTLPKQARNYTPGKVAKTEMIKSGSIVRNTDDKKSDVGTGLSAATQVVANGNTIDNDSNETTETRKNEDGNLSPDSMPLAMFLRHSQKKVKVATEPKTKKERKQLML